MSQCKSCKMEIHDSLAACPLCGQPTGAGYAEPVYPQYRHVDAKDRQKSPFLGIMILLGIALLVPALVNAGFQLLLFLHIAAAVICLWPALRNPVRSAEAVPAGEGYGNQENYYG